MITDNKIYNFKGHTVFLCLIYGKIKKNIFEQSDNVTHNKKLKILIN